MFVFETAISVFSALGAFGNVVFLTVLAGFGRVAGRDMGSQGRLAADRSRRAGARARRQAVVRSTRVRRRAMADAERAQRLAAQLEREKVRRNGVLAGVSAVLAMGIAQRSRLRRAVERRRAARDSEGSNEVS